MYHAGRQRLRSTGFGRAFCVGGRVLQSGVGQGKELCSFCYSVWRNLCTFRPHVRRAAACQELCKQAEDTPCAAISFGAWAILVHSGPHSLMYSASKPPDLNTPGLGVLQDHKKFLSEEPAFTLLSADLVAVDRRIQNVARYLPSVRWVQQQLSVVILRAL